MTHDGINQGIAMKFYKVERFFFERKFEFVAKIVFRFMQIFLGCTIPYTADIAKDCVMPHFHGITIVYKAVVGSGTYIYQNVTIGGARGGTPSIGSNCLLGAGCVVLGDVKIGNNVKIGANAVVVTDIPDDCTCVGVPAKIIKYDGNIENSSNLEE